MRDALAMDISDIGIMGACRHWPRNFATEGLKPDSVDELFFREGEAVRCAGGVVRELLSSVPLGCRQSEAGTATVAVAGPCRSADFRVGRRESSCLDSDHWTGKRMCSLPESPPEHPKDGPDP